MMLTLTIQSRILMIQDSVMYSASVLLLATDPWSLFPNEIRSPLRYISHPDLDRLVSFQTPQSESMCPHPTGRLTSFGWIGTLIHGMVSCCSVSLCF